MRCAMKMTYEFSFAPRSRTRFVLTATNEDGDVVGFMKVVLRRYNYGRGKAEAHISDVEVDPTLRRQGIALGMVRELHKRFPNHVVVHSLILTDAGARWARSLPKRWNRITSGFWVDDNEESNAS